jgi:hypothetical protein
MLIHLYQFSSPIDLLKPDPVDVLEEVAIGISKPPRQILAA